MILQGRSLFVACVCVCFFGMLQGGGSRGTFERKSQIINRNCQYVCVKNKGNEISVTLQKAWKLLNQYHPHLIATVVSTHLIHTMYIFHM